MRENTVQNIINKVKEHGTIENLPKIGHPRLHSEKTVRSLIRDAKINPKKTVAVLLKDWKSSLPFSISTVSLSYENITYLAALQQKTTVKCSKCS